MKTWPSLPSPCNTWDLYTGIQIKSGSSKMKTAFDEVPASLHQRFESSYHGSFTSYLHFSPAVLHLEAEHNKVECF